MPSSGMLDHSLTMSGCVGRLNTLYVFLCCSLLRVATFDFTCFGRCEESESEDEWISSEVESD